MSVDSHTYGFKTITPENWATPDMPTYFPGLTQDLWLAEVLAPRIDPKVPEQIRAMFECARGMFVYGYLFYPLCTLAIDQLYRLAEAAAADKCKAMGFPLQFADKKGKLRTFTFSVNINRLVKAGAIPQSHVQWWDSARKLRNFASHPDRQTLMPPGALLPLIQLTADHITQLYT